MHTITLAHQTLSRSLCHTGVALAFLLFAGEKNRSKQVFFDAMSAPVKNFLSIKQIKSLREQAIKLDKNVANAVSNQKMPLVKVEFIYGGKTIQHKGKVLHVDVYPPKSAKKCVVRALQAVSVLIDMSGDGLNLVIRNPETSTPEPKKWAPYSAIAFDAANFEHAGGIYEGPSRRTLLLIFTTFCPSSRASNFECSYFRTFPGDLHPNAALKGGCKNKHGRPSHDIEIKALA